MTYQNKDNGMLAHECKCAMRLHCSSSAVTCNVRVRSRTQFRTRVHSFYWIGKCPGMGGTEIGIKQEWAATGLVLGEETSLVHKNENYMKRASEHYSNFVETFFIYLKKRWQRLITIVINCTGLFLVLASSIPKFSSSYCSF